ncbi:MAG TPA: hypothetical protein VGY57_00075, partial [Vicinamibacterales bacterium]|nr:hypothetical protein [Vicinamibacterales bacterium]
MIRRVFVTFAVCSVGLWAQSQNEATRLLQEYVAIDTSNPPGDTKKAADFVASILERDGIAVTR